MKLSRILIIAFCFICSIQINYAQGVGQFTIKLNFLNKNGDDELAYYNQRNKKIKEWFLLINGDEIKMEYNKNGEFRIKQMRSESLVSLVNRTHVVIKVNIQNKYYIGVLPLKIETSDSGFYSEIKPPYYSKSKNKKFLLTYHTPNSENDYELNTNDNLSLGTQNFASGMEARYQFIELIACDKYKNEYENGL